MDLAFDGSRPLGNKMFVSQFRFPTTAQCIHTYLGAQVVTYNFKSSEDTDCLESRERDSKMPPRVDNEEDYGLSSSDEADLLALEETLNNKRKASNDILPPSKRLRYPSAITALTENFGMKEFRLKQEEVISRILGGDSAVVVFPTGGGKSLCYQIPALVIPEEDKLAGIREGAHGITLVVSPLIALMKDQVDALVRRGIKAASLDSSKSREEYIQTCDMLRNGELRILYCAPERLNNEGFVEQMKYVRGGVRLLAVDEAHCISEWGHAFRPDYLSKYCLYAGAPAHKFRGIQVCQ